MNRISSKRLIGNKSIIIEENNELILKPKEKWGFYSLKNSIEKSFSNKFINKEYLLESLKKNILFFETLKLDLQKKYKNFEENFSKPIQIPPIIRRIPPPRRTMTRAQSQLLPTKKVPHSQIPIRPIRQKKSNIQPEQQQQKQLSSTTIWNSVQKFFNIIPSYENFKKILDPIEISNELLPLGPHYSLSINKKLSQRFRNESILLKIPSNFMNSSSHIEASTSVIFHRLLSSLISPLEFESTQKEFSQKTEIGYSETELFQVDDNIFPNDICGTSNYSILTFEEKLPLEIKSLNLIPNNNEPLLTDNEIMNEIHQLQTEFSNYINYSNKIRNYISNLIKINEKNIIERHQKIKNWGIIIEKCEQIQKKQQGRPKSRDKLV